MADVPGPDEPVLVTLGDISVTATRVYTPSGSRPLSEVNWNITDLSMTSQAIPTWAIVCAVVFFLFCFLGLLFLLAKETRTQGSLQVTVHGPGFVHTATLPVYSPAQVADINARVNYARTLAVSYGAPDQLPAQPWQGWDQPGQGGQQQPGQGWQQPGQGWQ
jgi:hypothetical protein